jgi:hypothetical protein
MAFSPGRSGLLTGSSTIIGNSGTSGTSSGNANGMPPTLVADDDDDDPDDDEDDPNDDIE